MQDMIIMTSGSSIIVEYPNGDIVYYRVPDTEQCMHKIVNMVADYLQEVMKRKNEDDR